MNSPSQSEPWDLRPPRAVALACAFDVFIATALTVTVAFLGYNSAPLSREAGLFLFTPLLVLAGAFLLMATSLRRLCAWVWVGQLIALCLVIGVLPVPGLVLVPLLVAWCGPGVRDWFDPPAYREFG